MGVAVMTKQELLKYLTDCKELKLTLYNLERERDRLYGYMNSLGIVIYLSILHPRSTLPQGMMARSLIM